MGKQPLWSLARFETSIMCRCPRYGKCSAPKCPLDPGYHNRADRQRGEPFCGMEKEVRLRIVAEARKRRLPALPYLPYGGLTANEFAARERWDRRSEDQKQQFIEAGKRFRYAVGRKTEDVDQGGHERGKVGPNRRSNGAPGAAPEGGA